MFASRLLLFLLLLCGCLHSLWAANPDTLILSASQPSTLCQAPISLSLQCNTEGAAIYFTTDGTAPTQASRRYTAPLSIDTTIVLQAVAYRGGQKSAVLARSFIFGEFTDFPVVSIIIEPAYLFDPYSGLHVRGPRASKSFPYTGANYNSNKEVNAFVDFIESDKSHAFGEYCRLRIFGGYSRMFPQKSLALMADEARGSKRFKHEIFPNRPFKSYKHFVLRNSGSDFGGTHLRDAFITSLGAEMGLTVQAYRPSITYINGKYWGILNLREKINKHFLSMHFGVDKDSLDLLEHNAGRKAGSKKHYEAMRNYMQQNDLSIQKHYDYICTQMDVVDFADYQIVQIFIDNQDAGGNIKFWHPQEPKGRWRWILFDTDFGFGHYGTGAKNNSLAFHTEANGPNWPNPPWSTFNLRQLLKNEGFRDFFILRFLHRMNTILSPQHTIPRLDSMAERIRPEMPRHWKRWGLEEKRWTHELKKMREFGEARPANVRQHLRAMFPQVGNEVRLRVEVVGSGRVEIDAVIDVRTQFEGIYFQNLPIPMRARSTFRAQFSHWEVMGKRQEKDSLQIKFGKDTLIVVRAVFREGQHPLAKSVIINEVCSQDSVAGDWVELYNPSTLPLNLKGWTMTDASGNQFTFPAASLPAGAYLVLVQSGKQFAAAYPNCPQALGDFRFGLDKRKDAVLLYDSEGLPVDSFGYDLPKGDKKAERVILVRRDPQQSSANSDNWRTESRLGSPALPNPDFVEIQHSRSVKNIVFYSGMAALGLGILTVSALGYTRLRRRYERLKTTDIPKEEDKR